MAVPPNLQKLIIPGKNTTDAHPGYGIDARSIEQWANIGIVRKLIAGSNITLTPSDGVDAGNGIEIAASGGGGGTTVGIFGMGAGPDSLADNTSTNGGGYLSPAQSSSFGGSANLQSPLWGVGGWLVGGSWVVATDPGASISMMPFWIAPAFTGGPIVVNMVMMAVSTDYNNQTRWDMTVNLTSGQVYQTVIGDWNNEYTNGANISMVAGTGSGSGLVANNGVTYLASVYGQVLVPGGTVFT